MNDLTDLNDIEFAIFAADEEHDKYMRKMQEERTAIEMMIETATKCGMLHEVVTTFAYDFASNGKNVCEAVNTALYEWDC